VRVPRFIGEIISCFSICCCVIMKILDHRSAFRLQAGQLVVREVECRSEPSPESRQQRSFAYEREALDIQI